MKTVTKSNALRYQVRDSEAGNAISSFSTIEECKKEIESYENEDGESVCFYEIFDSIKNELV